jgi:hypothetical protein
VVNIMMIMMMMLQMPKRINSLQDNDVAHNDANRRNTTAAERAQLIWRSMACPAIASSMWESK